jgi:hypothetical protein
MFKDLWNVVPTWFIVWTVIIVIIGSVTLTYTIQKCGFVQTMLLGNGAVYAAYSGMCDK